MLAVRPPRAPKRPREPTVLEQLNDSAAAALQQSSELFAELADCAKRGAPPDAARLAALKAKAKLVNRSISRTTRLTWLELDRMKVDSAMASIAASHDALDERANAARVVERIRTFSNLTEGSVDRAVSATMTVQNMISAICACPVTSYHGAPLLHDDVAANHDSLDSVFLLH